MTDEELLELARQTSDLTAVAQDALASEISARKLKVEPEVEPKNPPRLARLGVYPALEPKPAKFAPHESDTSGVPSVEPGISAEAESDGADSYVEDRTLVTICTVYSRADALQVQNLLDQAGIPFYMGEEEAQDVDAVTSNFAEGVSVLIMSIGVPWARVAMEHYEPKDDPNPRFIEEPDEVPVRCPKCHSTEVIFEELVPVSSNAEKTLPRFKWICDSCGHEWEDDGVAKE